MQPISRYTAKQCRRRTTSVKSKRMKSEVFYHKMQKIYQNTLLLSQKVFLSEVTMA